MKKIVTLTILLFTLYSISVAAIGISPASIKMDFEPNYEETFTFQTEIAQKTDVVMEGSLSEYLSLEENNIATDGTFKIKLSLPDMIDTPGENKAFVKLIEEGAGGGMIAARAAIRTPITVVVPFEGVFAAIDFRVSDMNVDDNVNLAIVFENKGTKDISSAKATINIVNDKGETVETLQTQEATVPSKDSTRLSARFDASRHSAGNYVAKAIVTYDGNTKEVQDPFKIGDLEVLIINHTTHFVQDSIEKFEINVESGWNNKISDIFATVQMSNDTGVVASFKTPSIELEPWKQARLESFFDANGLAPGSYDLDLSVTYVGKETKKSSTFHIIPIQKTGVVLALNLTTILIVVAVVLIALNVFVILRRRKKS